MSVSVIFKIAAVGILVTILSQVLKHSGREEQAFLVSLAGLIPIFMTCLFWCRNCFLCEEKIGRK